jgi:carboxylesterase
MKMAEPKVWEDAQPFRFEGNSTGVLVIHGFTGCTQSMLPYGKALAARGYTVLGPRLPGHGTTVEDMASRKYTEWTAETERALQELCGHCAPVFVTGLSMGGTITLTLAAHFGDKITGIIPINALALTEPLLRLAPILKYLLKTRPGVGSDIKRPEGKESCYDQVPLPAVPELTALLKVMRAGLPGVRVPALVIASRQDHVVKEPANAEYIMANLGSKDKKLLWLENSYHVATLDNDAEFIFEQAAQFIERRAGSQV